MMQRLHAHAHIGALDGVRAIACLMVMAFHAQGPGWFPFWHVMPFRGVLVFFVLSGFIISYHYLPGRADWRYWLGFGIRRLLRLYPAYALVILGCLAINSYAPGSMLLLKHFNTDVALKHLLFLRGWLTFWVMPVEMRFYLAIPFIGLGLLCIPSLWRLRLLLLAAIACLAFGPPGLITDRQGTPLLNFIGIFLIGLTAAQYHRTAPAPTEQQQKRWSALTYFSLGALGWCLYQLPEWEPVATMAVWNADWLLAPLVALLLLCLARSGDSLLNRALACGPLRFIARLSFSLYLLHMPLFMLAPHLPPLLPHWLMLGTVWAGVLLAAWLLNRYIERPFNALGKKLARRLD